MTPGDQSSVELDAANVDSADRVTVFYVREGKGVYSVSVIEPGKAEEVEDAG